MSSSLATCIFPENNSRTSGGIFFIKSDKDRNSCELFISVAQLQVDECLNLKDKFGVTRLVICSDVGRRHLNEFLHSQSLRCMFLTSSCSFHLCLLGKYRFYSGRNGPLRWIVL